MKIAVSKIIIIILMFVIPFNYIIIESIGNIYLSTVLIFVGFLLLFIQTKGNLLNKTFSLLSLLIFSITLISTSINVIFFNPDIYKFQTTSTIIYLQLALVFVVVHYYYENIKINYIFKLFVLIALFSLIRVVIEEPNHIFKLSTAWEERIESLFIGGVNNFALILGIAFTISFFEIKKIWIKVSLCIIFLLFVILTMSRGGLFATVLTLFITAFYDTNQKTFKNLVKYSFYLFIIGIIGLFISGKTDLVLKKIGERFFSLFNKKVDLNAFFSSRGDLISEILTKFSESSIFQIFFGHGNGSIDFINKASKIHYETSHNVFIDILYKNGILLLLVYLVLISYILWLFIKKRDRNKLTLFGVFVFFQLELIVNPIIFAGQIGWLYSIFMVYFLHQNKIRTNLLVKHEV